MDAAGSGSNPVSGSGNEPQQQQQLLITGTGDQPIVMSAEDAAQLFSQAGIHFDSGSGQVIIGDVQPQDPAAGDVCIVLC